MGIVYAELWFKARPLRQPHFQSYIGKTLRGALGLALKRLVCHNSEHFPDEEGIKTAYGMLWMIFAVSHFLVYVGLKEKKRGMTR